MCMYVCIYIYICFIHRERDRERLLDDKGDKKVDAVASNHGRRLPGGNFGISMYCFIIAYVLHCIIIIIIMIIVIIMCIVLYFSFG